MTAAFLSFPRSPVQLLLMLLAAWFVLTTHFTASDYTGHLEPDGFLSYSHTDTASYDGQQASAGLNVSVCVPPFCYGQTVAGSANASGQTIKNDFASVNQQSGIYAGAGGFDVTVGNHTQLDGGVISGTAAADQNSLTTQTLGHTDLENHAQYSGTAAGLGLATNGPTVPLVRPDGIANTGDSASGVTQAAVSPGTITVKSDQQDGTDSTAGLSRDPASANQSVHNDFDLHHVQDNLAFAQSFGQVATYAAGQIADRLETTNPAFAEGGAARDALHAAVAAINAALSGGNIAGAVGGSLAGDTVQALVQPVIDQTVAQARPEDPAALRNALNEIVAAAGGAAGGALAGGGASSGVLAGAGAGLDNEVYNSEQDDPDGMRRENEKAREELSKECAMLDGGGGQIIEGYTTDGEPIDIQGAGCSLAGADSGASNAAAVQTAARNLGVNLDAVTVNSNGVAQVTIGIANSMSFPDVQT